MRMETTHPRTHPNVRAHHSICSCVAEMTASAEPPIPARLSCNVLSMVLSVIKGGIYCTELEMMFPADDTRFVTLLPNPSASLLALFIRQW